MTVNIGDHVWDGSFENHNNYAKIWGYDMHCIKNSYDKRDPKWQKIPATLDLLNSQKYDYVFWIDADAFFVARDRALDSLVALMEKEESSWLFSGTQPFWLHSSHNIEILKKEKWYQ